MEVVMFLEIIGLIVLIILFFEKHIKMSVNVSTI